MPTAVVLLILVAQVTACQPDTEPGPVDQTPDPVPTQPDNTTQVQTSPYSLTSAPGEAPGGPRQPPANCASPGVLTTESALGPVDFRYDAFVVTARESGTVIIQSDVVESQGYKYGYGYPLSMATIEDGVTFTAGGGSFYQNALETGTAVTDYPVQAGRQYVIVYKTFGSFTPLTYCLTLPPTLTIEGRIYTPPTPVPVPANSSGLITLQNPRPDALKHLMLWLNDRVSRN